MRPYAKITPSFWIGGTGRQVRKHGAPAQLLALYLMSCPMSNMIGLYYLPKAIITYETGLSMEAVDAALLCNIEAGFCRYDEESQVVWVPEMARFQIEAQLTPKDKRTTGIQAEYDRLPDNPFLGLFYAKYAAAFCMSRRRRGSTEAYDPEEEAAKGPPCQEQEQEQKQKQNQNQKQNKNLANTSVLAVISAADDAHQAGQESKSKAGAAVAKLLLRERTGKGTGVQIDADDALSKPGPVAAGTLSRAKYAPVL